MQSKGLSTAAKLWAFIILVIAAICAVAVVGLVRSCFRSPRSGTV
jgi:hypothetical protein